MNNFSAQKCCWAPLPWSGSASPMWPFWHRRRGKLVRRGSGAAGIGQLTLVDHDQVGLTNLNRQAEALHSTLGLEKTAAMAQRIQDINPTVSST